MIAKWCYLRKAMKNEVVNQKKVMTNDLIQNENLKKIAILKLSINSFNVSRSEIETKEQYASIYDARWQI